MSPREKRLVVGVAIVSSIGVVGLVSVLVQQHPRFTSWKLGAIYATGITMLVCISLLTLSKFGLAVRSDSHKRRYVDLVYELPHALQLFGQDIAHSIFSRPYVGVFGAGVTFIFTVLFLVWWPGHSTPLERVGIGLGVAGVLFGMLAYHAALGVERSIRDSITDFGQFLKATEEILEGEILLEKKKVKKFLPTELIEGQQTQVADLILLLWFPYYGLTKDFNKVGRDINRQLQQVHDLAACRTHLVTAKDPFGLMLHFDEQYGDETKRYSPDALRRIAGAIGTAPGVEWDQRIATESAVEPPIIRTDPGADRVLACVDHFKRLLYPASGRHWSARLEDNKDLMNGLVQIVWTVKKAAIVFMPPERRRTAPVRQAYKCSGFVTEDPFMLGMIRDLIEIRFDI